LIKQIVGSSGSIGANYREANDALGYNDFVYRLKISRKEAKETLHWLELIATANPNKSVVIDPLYKECNELIKILSSMIGNAIKNHNKTST
jgi:four helix bundle protein